MIWLYAAIVLILLVIHTLASYVDRIYSELGKFLSREFEDNMEVWEQQIEPTLGFSRERLALCAAVLAQLSLAAIVLVIGAILFGREGEVGPPTLLGVLQAALGIVLVVLIFSRLLPYAFFTRTRGVWVLKWRWLLRLGFYAVLPAELTLEFLLSIVSLAHPPQDETKESEGDAVDALIEAGEEEGILEESDRDLVRSAVEFGDKIVREVMTPRPSVFAVAGETTLADFLAMLEARPFSRVPVFEGTLDTVTGIVFSHDLLQIADKDASTRTVASLQRPAAFVPETKRVNELLREMQRDKQHMCIVIDEYGGVSGLVTIEDLLEEIVGAITDEHEDDSDANQPKQESEGVWIVPGNLEVDALEALTGDEELRDNHYAATTVAGLVSEVAGRIPMAGEVVLAGKTRLEVLASTDRRVERLRVSAVETPAA
ncbi:MAG TPA: hemolysin family protein [Acidobacteriaceae bacterium]|nr:hemolysin family protein [Acidobacteriaceae bacterium]